jgi:ubiquinone/menaquinone biosynthesis C-methylase UbiE
MTVKEKTIKDQVKERYGALADQQHKREVTVPVESCGCLPQVESDCCTPTDSSCCGPTDTTLAEALYEQTDLETLPDSVTDISLGCGNPTAIASLKPGETVLDLGSGGGIDCFIAAKAVGSMGYVIGVDMTDEMLTLANKNKTKLDISNVEFRKGEIEDLPVESNTVDIIISNCVINLSPDKDAVFREAFRVLKPGGRFAVSDIVTEGDFPESFRANIEAWVGCITGAIDQSEYLDKLRQAGFTNVEVQSRKSLGIEALELLDEESREAISQEVDWSNIPPNLRVYSANIVAYKPS